MKMSLRLIALSLTGLLLLSACSEGKPSQTGSDSTEKKEPDISSDSLSASNGNTSSNASGTSESVTSPDTSTYPSDSSDASDTSEPVTSPDTSTDNPTTNEPITLSAGDYTLIFEKSDGKWGFSVSDDTGVQFINKTPASVTTVTSINAVPVTAVSGYDSVKTEKNSVICKSKLTSDGGSVFEFIDTYRIAENAFVLDRSVSVSKVGSREKGFATVFSVSDSVCGKKSDYEYFIPSIIYKDSSCLGSGAIMAKLTDVNYVKETRCGTPLAMLRGKDDGYSIALVHVNPELSSTANRYTNTYLVSNTQQYGSIGFTLDSRASVDFVWPSTETPVSYVTTGTVRRYHEIAEDTVQSYILGIIPAKSDLYNDAMVNTYLSALSLSSPNVEENIDLDKVYSLNMELYNELYLKYNGTGSKYSSGYPFAVNVKDFSKFYAVSFQMGFIGAQTAIASELVREGVLNGNSAALEKGREILNFWTADYVYKDVLPPSWWNPSNGGNAGGSTGYPSFLRCVVDGAEGILNACIYAESKEIDCTQWKNAAIKIADFLVSSQNDDGSYYRAYNTNGTVCTDTSSAAYQGTSKLNTPVAIRFLCSMYEYTGQSKYRDAAIKAAEYCYDELYLKIGKYVGGTPDNPNVPDKEAAIYALYAFSAIYDLTGDNKYYSALEHAAVSAMSWVYTYDYAVKYSSTTEYASLNIFENGNTAGWSIIATGHSATDVFGSNAYYELFRQYIRSGNKAYLTVAGLLQNNTKKAMDLDGSLGYKYGGFALEACNTADWIFFTAENGVWLPWISAAFMEPMIKTEDKFGSYDIYELLKKYTLDELKKMI